MNHLKFPLRIHLGSLLLEYLLEGLIFVCVISIFLQWEELLAMFFVLSFQNFVEACLKHGNKREAMKYIPRIVPDKKVQCLIKMG